MSPTRREFMKTTGALLGASALGLSPAALAQALRENGTPPTMVCIYLRGGADALNAIVPAGDSDYYAIRPTLAIPARSDNPNNPAVLPINNFFGFHPSMAPLHELYRAGRMTAIINAGSTHPTRSHFDAQDFMERAAPGIKSITEGWLNRYLTATASSDDPTLRAVSLQPVLPRSLRGEYPVLAVPGYGADRAMQAFKDMYSCQDDAHTQQANDGAPADEGQSPAPDDQAQPRPEDRTQDRIVRTGADSIEKLQHLQGLVQGEAGPGYPKGTLGRQLADIAKLIKAGEGLEVAAVDYGGWDHHAYQGGSRGTMANMLGHLSQSIKAFHDDLGPLMDKTLVMVMSEFGRTARENGNNGTDHGHGGYMMAIGGPVKGERLYGRYTGLGRNNLYQGRDLPVHTDFRRVFAECLHSLYGFDTDAQNFFPDYQSRDRAVGFLNPVAQG